MVYIEPKIEMVVFEAGIATGDQINKSTYDNKGESRDYDSEF